jgi:DNA-binding response OmpR family regulator
MVSGPVKVMIIEDEPEAADLFSEMMRLSGFQVLKFLHGASAMAAIASEKPSLVILDVMMPDLSGLDVLRHMRSAPESAGIPVIIVSAKSMPSDIKDGLDAGAAIYLTKPVTFLELKRAVERVLQGGAAQSV